MSKGSFTPSFCRFWEQRRRSEWICFEPRARCQGVARGMPVTPGKVTYDADSVLSLLLEIIKESDWENLASRYSSYTMISLYSVGYKARLRFEGYGMDSSHDFYLHLLMAECYPVNGAVKMGHVMKPPRGKTQFGSTYILTFAWRVLKTIFISQHDYYEPLKILKFSSIHMWTFYDSCKDSS